MASSFLEKKAKKQAEELEKKYGSSAYGGTTWLNEQLTGKTTKKNTSNDDIAPVKTSKKEEDEPWYKSGLFADGYDFGDISKTILGLDKKNESVSPSKNLESLLTVYSNDDFKAKSGYVSTAAEGFWDRFGSKYGMGYNDLKYEYINNQNGIRGDIDAKAASWGADTGKTTSSYKEKALDFMTEEEVAVYNYYYQTEGKDKAEEFLDALAETLNARKAGKTFDSVQGNTTLEILSGFVAGNEQFEHGVKNLGNMIVGKDDYIPQTATQILTGKIREDLADDGFNVLGSSVGQMAFDAISTGTNMIPSIAVGAVNPVAGAALMGASAAGNAYQQDLNEGNDKGEARLYATTIGVLEGALQYALGGIGKLGGTSATISRAVSGIKNGALKFALEYGGKIASEGLEEGLQEVLDPIVKNVIHGTDEEVDWENVAYSALLGGVMGGVFGASEVSNTTLNKNETAVVEKVFNDLVAESETDGKKLTNREKNKLYDSVVKDMERGYISTDTIEDILGDKSSYDALSKEAEEYDTLYNTPSGQLSKAQQDRLTELDSKNKANPYKDALNVAKDQYSQSVFELVKSDRLAESYNEKGRRSQVYQADLTQYDAKQQAVVQKAIDSGVLNNTNRTHEFVDMIAKISADKGVLFDFTNNAKLKDSGFAIDGKAVNGYVTKDGITLNIDSAKSLNSVVGHEITHVLEGTELYDTLKQAVFDYAKSKGEYDSRLSKLTETYKSVKDADIDAELAADLVGDYLFTDSDFIHRLSTENRNVFQKIYDEIKYLCRVVTAGSKEARELEKVKKAFEDAYRADNKAEGGTKYSVSDTDGKQLTKEQQDFFKDSKMRDENGNLKVMYHGTPNGDFTVFKDGTYFTDNKEYADRYQNPGASSISSGKTASNPKTFEVYLDIKKPFDINDAEARRIYIEEYIKGGNAIGINPYLPDAEYDKINSIDWTEGEDLREFLIDNEYDYDGLVLDEGGTGGYGDDVQSRGTSYVVFSPEQVKSIDNTKPTADKDIRFSLSETVEETKDLMALHNLHSNELLKQLKMGGMAYPSIAITKPEMFSHDGFGEVSVILHKDAIDPKKSAYNKIYSADAYTPTFPNVDYEASEQVAANITSKVNELYDKLPEYYQRSVRSLRDYENIDDQLNRWGGEQRLVEKYADDYGMKQLYLAEKGEAVPVGKKTTETRMTDYQMKLYQTVADTIGEDVLKSFNEKGSFEKLGLARMAWLEKYGGALKDIYAEDWSSDGTMTKEEAMEIANDQKPIYWKGEIDRALKFIETGGVTVTETDDIGATQAKIDEKIEGSDYKRWLENLFSGIEGQSGIRNSKDIFTPSGNRRSFAQTHDPLTVDNIVKAMRKENQTGQGAFGGGSILGASAKEFGSIAEVKRNAGKLGMMDKAEHDAITDKINDTFWDIARRYANGKDVIDAQEAIAEAVSKNESKAGIARYLKQYDYVYQYTDSIGDEIIALRDYIRSLPTPYFEAKPRRGVGFDEVAAFVIPYDADVKLKQELLNRGYNIAEYDPKVEGDRQRVVNQFEEYKFSLSEVGEKPRRYGDYNIFGKDIGVNDPLAEFAPVAENATTEESSAVADKTKATVSEKESVAPVVISKNETTTVSPEEMRELFPDDLAPNELYTLLQEKEALEGRMLEMANSEDFTEFDAVTDRYAVVMSGIEALKKDEADRIGSLDDADIPPEREAVRGYGAVTAEDPFADRSETAVGSQKIKAYQYENPEVKPFFREAAYDLAEDIANSQPAERWYNDELYYASGGENGFGGQKRLTTKDIGDFKDAWGCSWDDLREAVNDIIEDHGKENHALAKRVEFLINDRLMYGYTNIRGERIEPNQAYLDFLKEKQINEYSKEAREAFFANAEQYAPFDIAPVPADPVKAPASVSPYDAMGAAPYGFDPITELQYKYGNLPDGEHPVREDSMPKSITGKDKVSLTARTVKGAGATPDEFVDLLHKETLGGRFSYIPITNSDTVQKAYDEIVKKGWEAARGEWEAKVRRGEVSAELTATGSLLLNHAAKAGDRNAWLSVLHDYQIMGTNAGQAIQAMRILKTLTPDDSLYMIERSVEQMVEDMKLGADIVIDENLKQAYLNAKTDGERDTARQAIAKDVARQIPSTAMDKWTALRYLNMLGNLRTQGRNILGNLGMSVTSGVKNTVATSIEWIANKASGGKFHRTKSIFVNKDQLKAAKNDFANVKDVALNGGKFNDPMAKTLQFQQEVQDARKIFKFAPLEGYRRATNWAMDTGDLVFSKAAYGRALAGYLKANGIKESDFSKIDQQKLDEARAYAINEAQETTFRDNNWLSSWVSKLGRGKNTPKGVKIVSEGVMPFRKTPANILLRAEEYSPLGLVNATVKSIQAAKGTKNVTGAEVVNSWAKALTGTGLFAIGMWLNNSGMLSGGPDEDDDKDWFEDLYGWQNYAIQIGDNNYTIDFLSPAAMPLLMGAQLNELRQTGGVELKDLEKALLSIADPMIEMSMLQGVNDTLDNIRYAESNMGQFLVNACVSYLTQGLTNSFLGQLERSFEGQRMSTYTDKDSDLPAWLQKALGKASAKTPGWDYNQIPYVDAWGEIEDIAPLPGFAENALSPSYISQGITDAVYEELNRLNDAQSDINVYPQTPDKTVTFDDAYGVRHEDYNLSAEEYVELAQLQGQTQKEMVEDILSNYQYSGLTDQEKAKAVQLAYQYAKEYSRQEVLGADGFSSKWMADAAAEGDLVNAIIAHTNEEMTFAYDYPEKYQFFTDNGISLDDYDSADEDEKREYSNMYSWVSDEDHPGRYSLAKAVSDDFQTFWQYKSDCNNFDAKDENGETVSGLKKERVIDYINSLDIDYGARLILFRSMYDGKKDKENYDQDIIDYLNSREDISYEDMEAILKELG